MRNIVGRENIDKSKSKTEYDIGRLDRMLETADMLAIQIGQMKLGSVIPFFSVLKNIYRNLKPGIYETTKRYFDGKIREINKMIVWTSKSIPNPPFELINKLEDLYGDLLELKQMMGLGFEINKELTKKEKWGG